LTQYVDQRILRGNGNAQAIARMVGATGQEIIAKGLQIVLGSCSAVK